MTGGFYVRHAESDVYDASDGYFTVTAYAVTCSLTLTRTGGGTETVTSDPAGINLRRWMLRTGRMITLRQDIRQP